MKMLSVQVSDENIQTRVTMPMHIVMHIVQCNLFPIKILLSPGREAPVVPNSEEGS